MGERMRGRIGSKVEDVRASAGWTRTRSVLAFLGWALALGLVLLLSSLPGIPGGWVQALQWGGAAWLFGLFMLVSIAMDDKRRDARAAFWIRAGSGVCAACGIVLIFGASLTVVALAVPAGFILGVTGKYWLQGL
ncbi:MAG TPA: hypothetical protein VFS95_14375 [Telluria sp.]|nr:hypothetical protein [Telluria sp.]